MFTLIANNHLNIYDIFIIPVYLIYIACYFSFPFSLNSPSLIFSHRIFFRILGT